MTPQPAGNRTALASPPGAKPALRKLVAGQNDPVVRLALYLGLGMVLVTFGVLPQVLTSLVGVNLYLSYVVGLPAIVAMMVGGGARRCLRTRTGVYWTAFGCWMVFLIPFSSWPYNSAMGCLVYWKTNLIMLFITGGLLIEWSDVRKLMNVMALAGVCDLIAARLLRSEVGGRFSLSTSMTIANPNDYAGHLLLMLPFLLWVMLTGRVILRIVALGCIGIGVYLIFATSSRGAMLALGIDVVVFAVLGNGRQKAALLVLGPAIAAILVMTVPSTSWRRLMGAANSLEAQEAQGSSDTRRYELMTALRYTMQHPVFGVGPFEFSTYEGTHERTSGSTHGNWLETHNSYAQVASECGIPGFLLFIAGIGSTVVLLFKTFRQARGRPDCRDIRTTAFCLLLGMAGFLAAIAFLNFAYFFYLPTLAGLGIGIWSAGQREFEIRGAAPSAGAA